MKNKVPWDNLVGVGIGIGVEKVPESNFDTDPDSDPDPDGKLAGIMICSMYFHGATL